MKVLGIDYGLKRVGIAIGDTETSFAFPHKIVLNKKALVYVLDLAKREKITKIVLGESQDFNMKDNPIMEEIRKFKESLEKAGLSVSFEKEFLTSHQASKMGASKENLDSSSATIILQSYLDKIKNR